MTEQRDHESEHRSADQADRQPEVKPEMIKDLDVSSDDSEAVAGGNSASRVPDQKV